MARPAPAFARDPRAARLAPDAQRAALAARQVPLSHAAMRAHKSQQCRAAHHSSLISLASGARAIRHAGYRPATSAAIIATANAFTNCSAVM